MKLFEIAIRLELQTLRISECNILELDLHEFVE